ncbi:MAG: hypothetical protein M5U26_20390 [Planctomycetota bacterium]|nr:hypothetical protein [Planctomycetota bacterium]
MKCVRIGILTLLLALLSAPVLRADTVTCNDGRVFEGEVLEDDAQKVRIRTPQGTVTLPRYEVKSVEYKESPFKALQKRRAGLAADDAAGHWELAQFAIENNLKVDAERLLAELRGMASPFYTKATRQLADLYAPKYPKLAVEFYDELVEKTGDLECKIKAKDLKQELDRKRKEAFEQARESLQKEEWGTAIESLRYAYTLTYAGVGVEGGGLTQETILSKLAEVRKALEDKVRARAKSTSQPGQQISVVCAVCESHSGWGACATCRGWGTVERIIPAQITLKGVIPEKKVQVSCPTCGGGKKSRCPQCNGTGLDNQKIDARIRWTLKSIADSGWTRKNDDPLRAMQDVAGIVQQKKLDLPDGYQPDYPTSKALRALLPSVPPPKEFARAPEFKKLMDEWRKTPQQTRGNYLCHYAFEVSLTAVAGAAPAAENEEEAGPAQDLETARRTAPAATPTLVSALPADWDGQWAWIEADFDGADPDYSTAQKAAFRVKSPLVHNLHPFVYLPEAQKAHAAAAQGEQAGEALKLLAGKYDYAELGKLAGELKPGQRLRLFGRVLFRPSRDPETALEVWSVDVSADPETLKLLALVRQPVTFNFEDTALGEAVELLALLTNTKIKVDVPKDADVTLNARVTKAPLAQAMTEMLKPANLAWVFDEKGEGLKVVQTASAEDRQKVEQVLRRLK